MPATSSPPARWSRRFVVCQFDVLQRYQRVIRRIESSGLWTARLQTKVHQHSQSKSLGCGLGITQAHLDLHEVLRPRSFLRLTLQVVEPSFPVRRKVFCVQNFAGSLKIPFVSNSVHETVRPAELSKENTATTVSLHSVRRKARLTIDRARSAGSKCNSH